MQRLLAITTFFLLLFVGDMTAQSYRYIRVRVTATNASDDRLRLSDFRVSDGGAWQSVSNGIWDNNFNLPASRTLDLGSGNNIQITKYDVKTVWNTTRTPRDFVIEGSNNNNNWTAIETVSGRGSGAYNSNTNNIFNLSNNPPPPPTYTLTVNATNGSVSKSPDKTTYNSGETVSLTASPNGGYQFDNWSGAASGSNNPVTITMNSNKTVTANFSATNQGGGNGTAYRYVRVRVTASNASDGRLRLGDFEVSDGSSSASVSNGLWDNLGSLPTTKTKDLGAGNAMAVSEYEISTLWDLSRTPRDFVIEGSNNNSNWTVIESVTGRPSADYNANSGNVFNVSGGGNNGGGNNGGGNNNSLTVSNNSLSFSSSGGSGNFNITSNVSWTVTENVGWLSLTPQSGSNNGSINLTVNNNGGTNNRSTNITVSGGGITRTVSVSQSGASSGGGNSGDGLIGTNFWFLASWSGETPFINNVPNNPWTNNANVWNQNFLNEIDFYSCLRFMDWGTTNEYTGTSWNAR
ncbi:MAG: BACON domain-containing carbohydrate-binding protein, partial [Bacteroidota bacterium]